MEHSAGVGEQVCDPLTWAERGAGYFLEGLPIAEGASIEWGGVGARPGALLPAPATAVVARRPLGPGGPATIHCRMRRPGEQVSDVQSQSNAVTRPHFGSKGSDGPTSNWECLQIPKHRNNLITSPNELVDMPVLQALVTASQCNAQCSSLLPLPRRAHSPLCSQTWPLPKSKNQYRRQ